jgi:hypothetical protein
MGHGLNLRWHVYIIFELCVEVRTSGRRSHTVTAATFNKAMLASPEHSQALVSPHTEVLKRRNTRNISSLGLGAER